MKERFKKRGFSSLLVLLLVGSMVISSACSGLFISGGPMNKSSLKSANDDYVLNHEVNKAGKSELSKNFDDSIVQQLENSLSDDDYVNYIIEVDEESLYTKYQSRTDITYQDYVATRSARINAENMEKRQNVFFKQIGKYIEAEFAASYTGLFNAFAVTIKYGDRHELKNIVDKNNGVSMTISEQYEVPTYEKVENVVDVWDTGIFKRPEEFSYKGEGMLVGVLDTGLDYTHAAFSTENLPDDTSVIRSKDEIAGIVPDLIANRYTSNLTVNDVYINEKVPYAYDYADFDTEVNTTEENAHGTHVSGIILGRSEDPKVYNPITKQDEGKYDKEGRLMTGIEGVAPLAQIAAMKVFSDFKGGAEDIFIYSAINDCVVLDVDVINMSLGRGSGFSDVQENPLTQKAYEAVNKEGINLVVAAGNGFSSGRGGHWGVNLASNPDSGSVGSPATYYQSFAVASINGVESDYMLAKDSNDKEIGIAYMTESGKPNGEKYDFIKDLIKAMKGNNRDNIDYSSQYYDESTGEISVPYVSIPGVGKSASYGSINNLTGKIALIQRGETTFTEKLIEAYTNGAIAAIIYNDVGGIISMSIEDNKVTLPSCSITMDAAANLKNVRGGTLNFMDKIKGTYSAGPFMSDFSSWGPTNSLELKPEITGHGGEIYSAFPGEDNYSRISGTSMAAPNVAGLVTIARQHLLANPEKYELLTNGKIDKTKLEPRIYQLMMSTATIPSNENSNPYSPRKIGAGLADIGAMLKTDAYLYTTDDGERADTTDSNMKNRTKLELFDDFYRREVLGDDFEKGVYEMDFFIRNLGNQPLEYNLRAITMTESLATDLKTVAELSYMLDNTAKEWKFNDQIIDDNQSITVGANTDAKVSLKLTLTQEDMDYIERTFINGMYVEGFIRLDAVNKDEQGLEVAQDLGVPYLAFYGDWNDAPMFDYSIYETDKDDKDPGLNEDDKRFSQGRPSMLLAKLTENGNDYIMPAGQLIFFYPQEYKSQRPYASEDKTMLSFSKESMHELYYVSGFLRGAKTASWKIVNADTGEFMAEGDQVNVRKDAMYSNLGGIELEISPESIGCKNGGTYTFSFTADLDYPKAEGMESHSWSFNFGIDTDAPIITNAELRVEKNFRGEYTRNLDFYIHDDNYLQAMTFNIYDKKNDIYNSIWDEGMRPIISDKNAVTRLSFNLTDLWQEIKDNDFKIETKIYDFALNNSYYEIDLSKLLYTTAEKIEFADIGSYMDFKKEESVTYTMLMDYYDKIPYDEDGGYDIMTSINLVPNQSVKLEHALLTQPNNVWTEDIIWESSNPSIVTIDKETGEIFSRRDGNAIITATSKRNPSVMARLNVLVLSERIMDDYGIPAARPSIMRLDTPKFENQSNVKELKSGEVFDLTVQPQPFFLDPNELEVEWSVGNALVASLEVNPDNPLQATITGSKGTYDKDGNYTPNYYGGTTVSATIYNKSAPANKRSVEIYIIVKQEFVVAAASLNEYNGVEKEIIIPANLNIQTIGDYCFNSLRDITKIVVPEGVEKIGRAAFAYMYDLREVILPSTIKDIGEWAFAAHSSVLTGLNTSLNIVDTTAFTQPVHVAGRAFVNNRALGTNTEIRGSQFLTPANKDSLIDSRLDTSKFRTIGHLALAYCAFLREVNLTGCRVMGQQALYAMGEMPAYYSNIFGDAYTNIILGEDTQISPYSIVRTGIRKLEIPMRRVRAISFAENNYLEEIKFTSDNLIVESEAFALTPSLKSIVFEGSVDYLASYAFSFSNIQAAPAGLSTLRFENKVRHIGDSAFFGAASLPSTLTLPNGLEYLGQNAFRGCTNIDTLVIPQGLTADLDFRGAFIDTKLANIQVEPLNPIYMVSTEIAGPDVLIKKLEDGNYEMVLVPYAKNIVDNFEVPDKVTIIGSNAFGFNKYIKSVDLGNVTKVESGALSKMSSLESVTLSDNMTEIPDAMFLGSINLKTVSNTAHIKHVGIEAFQGTSITEISLPICESIGIYAFAQTRLVSFTLSKNITEIPAFAFYDIPTLTEFTFHNDITKIGPLAFAMTNLSNLTIDTTKKLEIGYAAFYGCSSLETVKLPNAEKIGAAAFAVEYGEGSLTSLSISEVTDIGLIPSIEELNSLPSIPNLGMGAFENQLELREVSLPKVKTIEEYTFANSGVTTSISMPSMVSIGKGAFYGCQNMKGTLLITRTIEDIAPLAFANTGITNFRVQDGSENFMNVEGDVALFRIVTNGMELSHYPTGGDSSDSNFDQKDYLVNLYEIPEGTIRIAESAFTMVRTINKVTFPSTLVTIGHKAFFGSTVSVYEFRSFRAPVLEASYSTFNAGDMFVYYWAEYANFYSYFSPSDENLTAIELFGTVYHFFNNPYRYNTITSKYYADTWIANMRFDPDAGFIQQDGLAGANNTITGGGDYTDEYKYGLVMIRPANGLGYTDFVYAYYFDDVIMGIETLESGTETVISQIEDMPSADKLTASHESSLNKVRDAYEGLSLGQKAHVYNVSKLESLTKKMSEILGKVKTYYVSFYVGDAIYGSVQAIEQGNNITKPANPTLSGHIFDGWYLGNEPINFDKGVNSDMIITAKFISTDGYTVSFAGEGVDIESKSVAPNGQVEKPSDPTRSGYTFDGWYLDEEEYKFDTPVNGDIQLVAQWTKTSGCGCGTVAIGSGFGGGVTISIIIAALLLAFGATLLIKKRATNK